MKLINYFFHMDTTDVQKKCMELLDQFGESGFIVFGFKKEDEQFGVVYATHEMPANIVLKGMLWAAHDYSSKNT